MYERTEDMIKVLIIEDDEAHAELIERAFEGHRVDFNLISKHNLADALEYIKSNPPDIVVSDWLLPDGRGIEVIQNFKDFRTFPVLMITSHGNEEMAVEAMKAGALDYIVKSQEAFMNMPDFVLRGLREWEHIVARQQAEAKLKQVWLQTVETLSVMVEKRDPYTSGHQKRVGQLACAIGEELGLSSETIDCIYIAAILHDIGKINIPFEFLNKPGPLEKIEFEIIKNHPISAYEMLKAIDFPYPIAQIILQHHERYDGSGYPYGIKAEDILIEARIITVADVVEAISSHRPYRPSLGIEYALQEISRNAGLLFDPNVVAACLRLFQIKEFTFN